MAKSSMDARAVSEEIINDVKNGVFAPVYLLMGEEPYYVDLVCEAVTSRALDDSERDFNQFVMYGLDTTVDAVVSNARRYPMFAEINLVVLREAQMLKNIEELAVYTENPLDSTVLVIVYRGRLDARKSLYKSIVKNGRVLDSEPVRDYEMPGWISSFFRSKGLDIEPEAAALFAESVGTDMGKVALETGKMLKNLPEGTTRITVPDIESNVGISREFSIFELTKLLSAKNAPKAIRTATYIGASAKFAMPMATAALFGHFNKILRYGAMLQANPKASPQEKAAALGVSPYFIREYDTAVRNYPLTTCMKVISLIKDYDFKGKGGDSGEVSARELIVELITKILAS